jgi:hypothetical protein
MVVEATDAIFLVVISSEKRMILSMHEIRVAGGQCNKTPLRVFPFA